MTMATYRKGLEMLSSEDLCVTIEILQDLASGDAPRSAYEERPIEEYQAMLEIALEVELTYEERESHE